MDNTGLEDKFDIGTSYVYKPQSFSQPITEGMIMVWDKCGNLGEYMRERFKFVEQEVAVAGK